MERVAMDRLVEAHIQAEIAGNPRASVAMYTDDVEHDVVGFPTGPVSGIPAAQAFYEHLVRDIHTEEMAPTHRYYGENFLVIEHQWTGTVPGSFLGIPGHGRRIGFRMLHVWEFRDGRISRENVWLDSGSIVAQLTGPRVEWEAAARWRTDRNGTESNATSTGRSGAPASRRPGANGRRAPGLRG